MTRRPPGPSGVPLADLVEKWQADWPLAEIADHFGLTRQAVSFRLIRAGYSPAERLAERRAENVTDTSTTSDAYREQRRETIAQRTEARERAIKAVAAIAEEVGVTPHTLGQYATRSGPYAKKTKHHQHILPARLSAEGVALANRVLAAAAPWNAVHISRLAPRPLGLRTS
jgi:hypothetical protein